MKLPLKPLLLVMAAAATGYAALLAFGSGTQFPWQIWLAPSTALAAMLCLLNYVLRGLRWRLWMAQHGRHLGLGEGLRVYLAGYTFTPTPGNIGEAARGLLLARQPLGPLQSLAIFGAERLADLLALLLLSLPAVCWLLGSGPWAWGLLGLGASTLTLLAWGLQPSHRLGRPLQQQLQRVTARLPWLAQALGCLAHRPATWLGLTLMAWFAQGLAVWVVCQAQGIDLGVWLANGFYALAMVGGALSLLPAGLGGTEALFSGLLVGHGVPLATALSLTVLVRLLTLWLAVAIGLLALLYSAAFRQDLRLR